MLPYFFNQPLMWLVASLTAMILPMTLSTGFTIVQEVLLAVIILLGVWPFGCVHPYFEMWLSLLIAASLVVWVTRVFIEPALATLHLSSGWRPLLALLALIATVALPLLNSPLTRSSVKTQLIEAAQPGAREVTLCTDSPVPPPQHWTATASCLHPAGNWRLVWHLALMSGLMAVAASFDKPLETLRRLAIVGALTGVLLAVFSMGQGAAGASRKIYWYFEGGGGYGPFINKNHYPFFANCLLGLTLALFYDRQDKPFFTWRGLTNDPVSLGLIGAIAIQVCSLMLSLSRGGVVSALLAVLVISMWRLTGKRKLSRSVWLITAVGICLPAMFYWVGFDLLTSRLNTITESDAYLEDGRWHLWQAAWNSWQQFPLWGSGGETFTYWDTIYTSGGRQWNSVQTRALRADNELVDVACEYGLISALLLLVFLATWLPAGLHSARRSGLIAGAMVGLLAVALHSLGDFGLRVPATAAVASIVLGLVVSSGGIADERRPSAKYTALGLASSCLLLILGWYAYSFSTKVAKQDMALRQGWRMIINRQLDQLLPVFNQARSGDAGSAEFHLDLARLAFGAANLSDDNVEQQAWTCRAIAQAITARDLCPLVWEPQAWLYTNHASLNLGASPELYLQNAHRLHPTEPQIAFELGLKKFEHGNVDEAFKIWRASLLFSTDKLKAILDKLGLTVATGRDPAKVSQLDDLLPAEPDILLAASSHLADSEMVKHVLTRAVQSPEPWLANFNEHSRWGGHATLARIHQKLDQIQPSVDQYRIALRLQPENYQLRNEFARMLSRSGRVKEARNEVRVLEHLFGSSPETQRLMVEVETAAIK